jgi:hypothetical protein
MDRRGWLCILVLGLFYLGPAEYPPVARGPSASLVFIMCSSSSFEFAHRSFEVLGLCCREFVGPSFKCAGPSTCGRTVREGSTDCLPSLDRPEAKLKPSLLSGCGTGGSVGYFGLSVRGSRTVRQEPANCPPGPCKFG